MNLLHGDFQLGFIKFIFNDVSKSFQAEEIDFKRIHNCKGIFCSHKIKIEQSTVVWEKWKIIFIFKKGGKIRER